MSAITVTLPDGSERSYSAPPRAAEIAADIGAGLARAALAARVNGRLVDLDREIDADARVEIVTGRDPAGLEVLRHSTAHLLAQAVKQLYPEAQVTIGPVIENGFYYDFAFDRAFTPDDLERIEARMHEIAKTDLPVSRREVSREEAIAFFRGLDENYKAAIIAAIPPEEILTLYTQGDFTDLCRGPHVPSTGRLGAFKLTHVAGAYWRGDSANEMLQRIYGTAWADAKALQAYLRQREEAEKRDHRRIGKALDLFHQQEEAPGMVFWHPHGWAIWQAVEQYLRGVYRDSGYEEVRGPQILDVSLWKKSGHWDNYRENMFFTESEKREYAIKPMNCPGHVQIYNRRLHSYRDLPVRYGEFGSCHRNEPSGALHGLMRVRAFTQDDGHVFCTPEQIEGEVTAFHAQAMRVYADFGFRDIEVKIALRPEQRIGSDEVWDQAEEALRAALRSAAVGWEELPGEGVFYGPKIEYHMRDSIGRDWQVGTMQVDFLMPERLDAEYVDETSARRRPVMLHRAIVGSMERFLGILLEHYAGRLPVWLAPVQTVVLAIGEGQVDYAREVACGLAREGFRVETDLRNETIGYKIREHTLGRVPYLLVVGERERAAEGVAVRTLAGKDLGTMPVGQFARQLAGEVAARGGEQTED
ncbi:MAG TPA: threonine--tRNA ligase [Gammaproteobacteria bacterium]|nr:threonine--tRNA ligase [Gammaproteobacteria bacterium]